MSTSDVKTAYRLIPPDAKEAYRLGDLDLDDILPIELTNTDKAKLRRMLEGRVTTEPGYKCRGVS